MNHGRFGFLPQLPPARPPKRLWCALALLLFPALAAAAGPSTTQTAGLRLTWSAPDHPSGIYYVKEEGALTVLADCAGPDAAELSGEILFGTSLGGPDEDGGFKTLAVTPITPATLKAGQRAKIPLQLPFGAAGAYELRWRRDGRTQVIPGDTPGWGLQCIFAPRGVTDPKKPDTAPWITTLPRAATGHPGHLADYAQRTTVRRFVIDERFAFDPQTNIGLGFGASLSPSAKEIDSLLAQAAAAKVKLILRITLPPATGTATADTRTVAAFRQYVADALRRGQGAVAALVIVPEAQATEAQRRHFTACYQAAYETAQRADKNIALLGAGSALLTEIWLPEASRTSQVDALALGDAALDLTAARTLFHGVKKPLHLLPPRPGQPWPPAAAGLAAGAVWVPAPPPELDHGVTAHLLGGATLLQRLRITVPTANPADPDSTDIPFVAVFQGDGYALAAIAGFGAGTELDGHYPALARTPTRVESAKADDVPARPILSIGDDTRSMRVVDSAGAPVDCRMGDHLDVPVEDAVMYVLEGGAAPDLAGSLRVATPIGLPALEISLAPAADGLTASLHNVATRELAGTLRLIRTALPPDSGSVTLLERDFAPIPPGKSIDLPLELSREQIQALRTPLTVEIRTTGPKPLVQRSTLTLPAPRP